jgi:hypothetical protein
MEALQIVTPWIADILQMDFGFAVTNTERFIIQKDGQTLRMNIEPGQALSEATAMSAAIREKRPVVKNLDAAVYGFPVRVIGFPIMDELGNVIGAVGVSRNINSWNQLAASSRELNLTMEGLVEIINTLNQNVNILTDIASKLNLLWAEAESKFQQTDQILLMIKELTSQTHLIGLNAAIESARIGESGGGFNVIANEIRKLSSKASEENHNISVILSEIKNSLHQIQEMIVKSNQTSERQLKTIEKIGELSGKLQKISEKLSVLANEIYQ